MNCSFSTGEFGFQHAGRAFCSVALFPCNQGVYQLLAAEAVKQPAYSQETPSSNLSSDSHSQDLALQVVCVSELFSASMVICWAEIVCEWQSVGFLCVLWVDECLFCFHLFSCVLLLLFFISISSFVCGSLVLKIQYDNTSKYSYP